MMFKKSFIILILFSLVNYSFSQRIQLEFNPEAGSEYLTSIDVQTSIDQEVMGIDQSISMNVSMEIFLTPLDNEGDLIPVEYVYKNLEMNMISPAGEFAINSENKQNRPENIIFKAITNKKFIATYTSSGSIKEVKGINQIIQDLDQKPEIDPAIKSSVKQNLLQSFGNESFKNNLQNSVAVFPEHKVREGDQWKYSLKTSDNDIELIINNTAEVLEIKKETVRLRIKSEIESPDKGFTEINGNQFKINMKGSQIGESIIDRKTGMSLESTMNQTINGMMLMKTGSDQDELMEIPMTVKTKISMNTKRIK